MTHLKPYVTPAVSVKAKWKCLVRNSMLGFGLSLSGTRMRPMADSCKQGNESLRPKNVGDFTGKLRDYQLVKKHFIWQMWLSLISATVRCLISSAIFCLRLICDYLAQKCIIFASTQAKCQSSTTGEMKSSKNYSIFPSFVFLHI
jgi:hypothetical protein